MPTKIKDMPTSINETMIIETDCSSGDIEVYLNSKNEMFFTNTEMDATNFWFTISEKDWISLKKFIDDKFRMVMHTE